MNLAEVFTALPISTTNVLEKHLEKMLVGADPSREEIRAAAEKATDATIEELVDVPEEQHAILRKVPTAVVNHLFS